MPYELSRRNFKNAQRVIEHSSANMTTSLAAATKAASKSSSPDATLDSLDAMISKMQVLKRKLEALHEEETRIHKSAKARLRHLQDLYDVNSLVDVKYDEWSRTRLSRLLVDYLLREGYSESAAHLAQSKEIEDLVDVDAFVACHKIERSLREGMSTSLALDWCKEHSKELKKGASMLEFELRLQQYIELVRQGHEAGLSDMDGIEGHGMNGVSLGAGGGETKLVEARLHAKKYLSTSGDFELLRKAAGLLAYKPWDDVEPYVVRYQILACVSHCSPFPVALLAIPVGSSSEPLPLDAPQPLLAPTPTTPSHRPLCRPLCPENSSVPLRVHIVISQRLVGYHIGVPHLQHRAQRACAQRPLCAPHQEHREERPSSAP
jgi:macrophage erythroblast attacher